MALHFGTLNGRYYHTTATDISGQILEDMYKLVGANDVGCYYLVDLDNQSVFWYVHCNIHSFPSHCSP